MDKNTAREVMRRLNVLKGKIDLLPEDLGKDLMFECKLMEDKVRDKFYRSRKR